MFAVMTSARESFVDEATGLHVVRERSRAPGGDTIIHEEITDPKTGERWTRECLESVHTSVAEFMGELRAHAEKRRAQELALAEELAAMSDEDRVQWWTARLSFRLRCQNEAGVDRYLIFDADLFAWASYVDPTFAAALPQVSANLRLDPRVMQLCACRRGTAEWNDVRARIPERG